MNKIENLELVVQALEQIEVRGSGNMDKLLGCIKIINATVIQMKQEAAAAQAAPEVKTDGNGN